MAEHSFTNASVQANIEILDMSVVTASSI